MLKEIAADIPVDSQPIVQARETSKSNSPVAFMSAFMLREACEAQRDIARLIEDDSSVTHRPTGKDIFEAIPPEKLKLFVVSGCAIVFACLLQELEATLVEGQFSAKNFYDRYNHAVTGTLMLKWEEPENPTEDIPEFSRARMLRRAAQDRTFSSFFHDSGLLDLPHAARQKLEQEELIQPINYHILPTYYKVTKLLIRSNEPYGR